MRTSLIALCLVGGMALAMTALGHGAVPSSTIKRWQDEAPEVVVFTVLSIDETSAIRPWKSMGGMPGSERTTMITLMVRVDDVRRTSSNLGQDTHIVVQYMTRRYMPPPGPPDGDIGILLEIGDRAVGYLRKTDEKTYEPAGPVDCLVKLP